MVGDVRVGGDLPLHAVEQDLFVSGEWTWLAARSGDVGEVVHPFQRHVGDCVEFLIGDAERIGFGHEVIVRTNQT